MAKKEKNCDGNCKPYVHVPLNIAIDPPTPASVHGILVIKCTNMHNYATRPRMFEYFPMERAAAVKDQ